MDSQQLYLMLVDSLVSNGTPREEAELMAAERAGVRPPAKAPKGRLSVATAEPGWNENANLRQPTPLEQLGPNTEMTAAPPPSKGIDAWRLLNSPKASPIPPPESTDRGIPRRSEASDAREAAMRALAKRRGRRENSR